MSVLAELFVADREDALQHAASLDSGEQGAVSSQLRLELTGITDLEVELLAEVAASAAHMPEGVYELDLVDIEYESLLEVPASAVTALRAAALPAEADESDLIPDIARRWGASEELGLDPAVSEELVRSIVALAGTAESSAQGLYFWFSL